MTKAPNRLTSETFDLTLGATEDSKGHEIKVAVMRDRQGTVQELAFVGRGKVGHGMDAMFLELGIKCSRAIQGRDPQTGEEFG